MIGHWAGTGINGAASLIEVPGGTTDARPSAGGSFCMNFISTYTYKHTPDHGVFNVFAIFSYLDRVGWTDGPKDGHTLLQRSEAHLKNLPLFRCVLASL